MDCSALSKDAESLQVALDNFKDLENGPWKDLLMLCDYKPSTEGDIAAALEASTADDMKLVDRFQKQSALCLLAAKARLPGIDRQVRGQRCRDQLSGRGEVHRPDFGSS